MFAYHFSTLLYLYPLCILQIEVRKFSPVRCQTLDSYLLDFLALFKSASHSSFPTHHYSISLQTPFSDLFGQEETLHSHLFASISFPIIPWLLAML